MLKVLDLFCGAGGSAMGLKRAGFNKIIGVDIKPQPEYPFDFIQADVFKINLGFKEFNLIWASPPCQLFSTAYSMNKPQKKGKAIDLIDKTRKFLKITEIPYVIENVNRAPIRKDLMLCGTMFGLGVFRHRFFEIGGFKCPQPIHSKHIGKIGDRKYFCITQCGWDYVKKQSYDMDKWRQAIGINWITSRKMLAEAIPPKYAEYIGKHFIKQI